MTDRVNGSAVPLPSRASPAEEEAKRIVMGMVKRLGWQGVAQMVEMALPRQLAIVALAEGTLTHDETLVNLLGALERGTANVAQYLCERQPQKIVKPEPGVVA